MKFICSLLVVLGILNPNNTLSAGHPAGDLTPEAVVRCKHATALVQVGEGATATAFHIGNGLYLTNAHVVANMKNGDKIRLILDPADTKQHEVTAIVTRADAGLDLALLKSNDPMPPPSLEIGESSDLTETVSLTAFGYPFGSILAVGKSDYPSITVSVGRVTALRKNAGQLERIQLDASLNPGNSGGPVVNNAGQVVGVVDSGVAGSGINFAIPSEHLKRFLRKPEIVLQAPLLTKIEAGVPSDFHVTLVSPTTVTAGYTVGLKLSLSSVDARNLAPAPSGPGKYTASTVLLPADSKDWVELTVEETASTRVLRVKDSLVRVGARSVRLSTIMEIKQGVAPMVTFRNGQQQPVSISGLKTLETIVNGKVGTVDASRAASIEVAAAASTLKSIRYEVTVKNGTEVVGAQKGTIDDKGVRPDAVSVDNPAVPKEDDAPEGMSNLPPGVEVVGTTGNNHYYCAIDLDRSITWTDAHRLASRFRFKGLRGHLATITSPQENEFLRLHVRTNDQAMYWLGGYQDHNSPNYSEPSGGWRWVTGEPWNYSNWRGGEPNNVGSGAEDYLSFDPPGTWNDVDVSGSNGASTGFLVEFEK